MSAPQVKAGGMSEFALVRHNLFRKPGRTILLTLSIIVAFLIFGILGAVDRAFQGGIEASAADRIVTVNRINFTVSMPIAHVNRIRATPGVEQVSFADWFGGYYQDPRNFFQTFAIDPETYLDVYPDQVVLTPEQREAFINDRQGMLIGRALANQFGISAGDRIPVSSNIYQNRAGGSAWDFNVVALFDGENASTPTNYAIFHHEYFDEARTFGNDTVGWIVSRTEDPALNEEVMAAIDATFANSAFETETQTEEAFSKAFLEQLGDIRLIVTGVVGAAFATILMIVGTTMALAIRERTKELAVMKTLGFPSARLFRMVLSESVLLSLLGGLIGLGLATLILQGLSSMAEAVLPGLAADAQLWGVGVALMLALGLITGIAPAIAALRLNTAVALSKG